MAKSIEQTVVETMSAVADFPHNGWVAPGTYVGQQVNYGSADFTALDEGAARISGDASVTSVFLDRNPNRRGLEDATVLTVEGMWDRFQLVFREGQAVNIDPVRQTLVETIIGNIGRELSVARSLREKSSPETGAPKA